MRPTLATALGVAACLGFAAARAAPTETVLYRFTGVRDGANPAAPLVIDADGALYGTTQYGGTAGHGTVFKITPVGRTGATRRVLHSFAGDMDGAYPRAGLLADPDGALYGTTVLGGKFGLGTVFRLAPPPPGGTQWRRTILYSFRRGVSGNVPQGGLLRDASGALYGTARAGGDAGWGTVFKLTPPDPGRTQWTQTVLHAFRNSPDGAFPLGNLLADGQGGFYGTTSFGGGGDHGTVYRLTPPPTGGTEWTGTVLYSFRSGTDGAAPQAGVVADAGGALYGTTVVGGSANVGTVFRLAPPVVAGTGWAETVLYTFADQYQGRPLCELVVDAHGALYGTNEADRTSVYNGGRVFQLTPPAGGTTAWTYTALHWFGQGVFQDGRHPAAGLVTDAAGTLYGTTGDGGSTNSGTVFKLVP